jgi:hypothetical protein
VLQALHVGQQAQQHQLQRCVCQAQHTSPAQHCAHLLRLLRAVHVNALTALDETACVVDGGVDASVPDGLGHDALRILRAGQVQLGGHLGQGDAGVGQVDAAQACEGEGVRVRSDERLS